ncbi:MAG: protein kinase [Clostridia bacterium]|nr:protein kinase [Clostridia bacterium]
MESYDKYVGQVFGERYRIEKMIGIGGMAVVFRAYDMLANRFVAVKMLKGDAAEDEASVRRFVNESKAVAMLSHPNIVKIFDVSVKGPYKYIVMEYIEGSTLKSYMAKRGALSTDEIIKFCSQILRALGHAHSKGIVHRDIKPQNIMLLENGQIKVTDFGIAKLPNTETVTMTDKAIGTVYYISPEQASGRAIDSRSDLYSTSVMMYEMATGKLPFVADTPVSVALMQVSETPVPPRSVNPSIPVGLEQIILTAMEKDPNKRFQSAGQILKRLDALKRDPNVKFKPLAAPLGTRMKRQVADKKQKNRRYLSSSMLPTVLGTGFAFLIVCIIAAYYLLAMVFFNTDTDTSYILMVGNFIGQTYNSEFLEDLEENDYSVTIEYIFDESYESGTIVDQSPTSGEKRKVISGKQLCELTLTVSRGTETFTMPDFTLQDYRIVEDTLNKEYGVYTEIVEEYNMAFTAGYVFRTSPSAGDTVTVGDTVILYVSLGMELSNVSVPDFVGMTELKARIQMEKYNLVVGEVTYEYSDKYAEGVVINQSRVAYTSVIEGTTIDFVVSLGPEPEGNT